MNLFLQKYWKSLLLMVVLTIGIYYAASNSVYFKSSVTDIGGLGTTVSIPDGTTGITLDETTDQTKTETTSTTSTTTTGDSTDAGTQTTETTSTTTTETTGTGSPSGDQTTTPGDGSTPPIGGICGDGIVGASEICDDGNNVAGDGCFNCQPETIPPDKKPFCGDGILDPLEECENTLAGISFAFGFWGDQCVDCKAVHSPAIIQQAAAPANECPEASPCIRVIEMTHLQIDLSSVPPQRTFKMVIDPSDRAHNVKANADVNSVKVEEKVGGGVYWYQVTIPLEATRVQFDIDGIVDAFVWDYVTHGDADWNGKVTIEDVSKMTRYFMNILKDPLKMISQFVIDLKS